MMSMLKTMPPDGYSVGILGTSVFVVAAQQDIGFDPVKDLPGLHGSSVLISE